MIFSVVSSNMQIPINGQLQAILSMWATAAHQLVMWELNTITAHISQINTWITLCQLLDDQVFTHIVKLLV